MHLQRCACGQIGFQRGAHSDHAARAQHRADVVAIVLQRSHHQLHAGFQHGGKVGITAQAGFHIHRAGVAAGQLHHLAGGGLHGVGNAGGGNVEHARGGGAGLVGIGLHAQVGGVHHVDGAQVDHPFCLAVVGGQQGKGQVLVLVRRPRAGVGAGKHHAHLVGLRCDPAQGVGVPAAQLRQAQGRGVVVAQYHQGVLAPGLQHDRAPLRTGGRAVRLDGGGQQAGFGEGTRRWETVLCLAHLHQRARGALGGKPQVHPRVVRRCVQHEGLRQRIHGLHAEVDDL